MEPLGFTVLLFGSGLCRRLLRLTGRLFCSRLYRGIQRGFALDSGPALALALFAPPLR